MGKSWPLQRDDSAPFGARIFVGIDEIEQCALAIPCPECKAPALEPCASETYPAGDGHGPTDDNESTQHEVGTRHD